MNKNAIARIIIWSLTALLLVAALLAGLTFGPDFSFNFGTTHYKDADNYNVGAASVAGEINQIEINWINGSVEIEPYDGDTLEAFETKVSNIDNEMRYLVKDGKLIIQFEKSGLKWRMGRREDKDLTVKIPKGLLEVMKSLSVDGAAAKISISGLTLSDELEIDNVSGDIALTGIKTDTLDIDCVSSKLTAKDVTAGEFKFNSVSGGAVLQGDFSDIDADTTSGSIKLVSGIMPERIEFDAVSGGCNLYLPQSGGFTAKLDSVSGNLDTDFPVVKKHKAYIYGSGYSKFDFDTVSGNINISIND